MESMAPKVRVVGAWEQAAQTLMAEFAIVEHHVAVQGWVEGERLTARTCTDDDSATTEIGCWLPEGGPRFEVHRLGCHDNHSVASESPSRPLEALPSEFHGRADDPVASWAWMSGLFDRVIAPYCFGVDGIAWVARRGAEDDADRLVAAVRSVIAVAAGRKALKAVWNRVATELDARPNWGDGWSQMALEGFHAGVAYRAWVVVGSTGQTETRVAVDRTATPPPGWGASLAELQVEIEDHRIVAVLPSIVKDAVQIRTAVQRLAPFAPMSGPPYR